VNIAILGTGIVGRSLAARAAELGHKVTLGTRDPEATLARPADHRGTPAFAEWQAETGVVVSTFAEAAAGAELVVNATGGEASLEALTLAGAQNLAGKVLLDVSNPLDFSAGFPPTLFVKDTDSLAERIQRAFPEARVVKSLNTMTAAVMVRPARLGAESSLFVSGDDAEAKAVVTRLLTEFGHTDVIDLGELSTARGPEMYLPLWLRIWGALGTPLYNIKVVRAAG
jgi:predicted dinucleotide-binding enzyme